jgi:predicted dehydrogenase
MSKKRIRIGVAGLGRIGWSFHCGQISASKDFVLAAVVDPCEERRAEAIATYGCDAFADFDAMIRDADLDAVVIATPTHFHKAHALAAFRKGLHVLLEKPMAMNLKEGRSIASAAKRAGRILTVYQPHRLHARYRHLRRIIDSGKIGEVYHVRIGMFNFARRNDWQSLVKFGGGMLANYGAHCIDAVFGIIGSQVANTFCSLRRVASLGDADDVVKISYKTRQGAIGEIDINQASVENPYQFEVYGTQGFIGFQNGGRELRVRHFSARKLGKASLNSDLASANRRYPSDDIKIKEEIIPVNPKYAINLYADLAKAIRNGTAPAILPEETLAVMKMIETCREQAGRIIQTPLVP